MVRATLRIGFGIGLWIRLEFVVGVEVVAVVGLVGKVVAGAGVGVVVGVGLGGKQGKWQGQGKW